MYDVQRYFYLKGDNIQWLWQSDSCCTKQYHINPLLDTHSQPPSLERTRDWIMRQGVRSVVDIIMCYHRDKRGEVASSIRA